MVRSHVGVFIHGGHFILPRCHFVVAGFDGHAQFVQFTLGFQHTGQHTLRNCAKIMIIKLLAFGRGRAKQGAPGSHPVGAGPEEGAVDAEI